MVMVMIVKEEKGVKEEEEERPKNNSTKNQSRNERKTWLSATVRPSFLHQSRAKQSKAM